MALINFLAKKRWRNQMKKLKKWLICLFALAVLVLAGCQPPGGGGGQDFVGSWTLSSGGLTENLNFSVSNLTITDSGPLVGTLSCSIQSYDVSAEHIKLSITSGTGLYIGITGDFYILYNISGNTMRIGMSFTGYPAFVAFGPYIKQ
jgi:hypothetical protein